MEYTSGKEYREKRRKALNLPSGDTMIIRKLSSMSLAKLFTILGIADKVTEDMTNEEVSALIEKVRDEVKPEAGSEIVNLILTKGVAKPRIVLEDTDNDEELCIEDIDPIDFEPLLTGIMNFVGATQEASEERDFPVEEPIG